MASGITLACRVVQSLLHARRLSMSRFFCFVYGASLAWFCSISFAEGVEPTRNTARSPATTVPPQSSAKPGRGGARAAAPGKPAEKKRPTDVTWIGDYAQAWESADRQAKMLFVYFCKTGQAARGPVSPRPDSSLGETRPRGAGSQLGSSRASSSGRRSEASASSQGARGDWAASARAGSAGDIAPQD